MIAPLTSHFSPCIGPREAPHRVTAHGTFRVVSCRPECHCAIAAPLPSSPPSVSYHIGSLPFSFRYRGALLKIHWPCRPNRSTSQPHRWPLSSRHRRLPVNSALIVVMRVRCVRGQAMLLSDHTLSCGSSRYGSHHRPADVASPPAVPRALSARAAPACTLRRVGFAHHGPSQRRWARQARPGRPQLARLRCNLAGLTAGSLIAQARPLGPVVVISVFNDFPFLEIILI
jgi:hypothetical protein